MVVSIQSHKLKQRNFTHLEHDRFMLSGVIVKGRHLVGLNSLPYIQQIHDLLLATNEVEKFDNYGISWIANIKTFKQETSGGLVNKYIPLVLVDAFSNEDKLDALKVAFPKLVRCISTAEVLNTIQHSFPKLSELEAIKAFICRELPAVVQTEEYPDHVLFRDYDSSAGRKVFVPNEKETPTSELQSDYRSGFNSTVRFDLESRYIESWSIVEGSFDLRPRAVYPADPEVELPYFVDATRVKYLRSMYKRRTALDNKSKRGWVYKRTKSKISWGGASKQVFSEDPHFTRSLDFSNRYHFVLDNNLVEIRSSTKLLIPSRLIARVDSDTGIVILEDWFVVDNNLKIEMLTHLLTWLESIPRSNPNLFIKDKAVLSKEQRKQRNWEKRQLRKSMVSTVGKAQVIYRA